MQAPSSMQYEASPQNMDSPWEIGDLFPESDSASFGSEPESLAARGSETSNGAKPETAAAVEGQDAEQEKRAGKQKAKARTRKKSAAAGAGKGIHRKTKSAQEKSKESPNKGRIRIPE